MCFLDSSIWANNLSNLCRLNVVTNNMRLTNLEIVSMKCGNVSEYARVLLVIHILPERNSPEYEWMKTLADRYGLIRQGVLVENAVSHFANLDRNMIVENILKWISRRLHEIVSCNGLVVYDLFSLEVSFIIVWIVVHQNSYFSV